MRNGFLILSAVGLLACSKNRLHAGDDGAGGGHAGAGGAQSGSAGHAGSAGSAPGGTTGAGGTGVSGGASGTGGPAGQAGSSGLPGLSLLAGTLGGPGYVNGTGATARFGELYGAAIDGAGNFYVADKNTIRKIVIATGEVTTFAGMEGQPGSTDGTGAAARFGGLRCIASDGAGNFFAVDNGNRTIRKIVIATGAVSTLTNAAGVAANFDILSGIVSDGAGNLYVTGDQTVLKVTIATGAVATIAGANGQQGYADGTGTTARFTYPSGITSDGAGNLYVADHNYTIRKIVIATGAVTTFAGGGQFGTADGTGAAARFVGPDGMATDGAGNIFLTDSNSIRKIVIATRAVTTIAGSLELLEDGWVDGTGAAARFRFPDALVTDGVGNLLVADSNYTVRKVVIATGTVSTIAGTGWRWGSADGTGAAARFNGPNGVATDGAGNLFVADSGNNAIRKIVITTGAVTTLAGAAGESGNTDGTGASARFNFPHGITSDGAGNLFVADRYNYSIRQIVIATGAVTTLAGPTAGFYGFHEPTAITGDGAGNLFVSDLTVIWKVVIATGAVTALARVGSPDDYPPFGIATDGKGNLYFTDINLHTIGKIVIATGAVTTFASGFTGPTGMDSDGAGNLYVADGNTIRKVAIDTATVSTVVGSPGLSWVSPGPLPASLRAPNGVVVLPTKELAIVETQEAAVLIAHF